MVALIDGYKFALVAVTQCRTDVRGEIDLGYGTTALPRIVDVLDPTWRSWLGESGTGEIERANLVLFRSRNSNTPRILDGENDDLVQEVTDVWAVLQFSGIVERQTVTWLTGTVEAGRLNFRQVGHARPFFTSTASAPTVATTNRLRAADGHAHEWSTILASRRYKRIIRGANVLMGGLQEYYGQERLHQFVRSLEALILPQVGSTQRQFVHRCQTFTIANQDHAMILNDMFAMRSAVEHLHESASALEQQYADEQQRMRIAERRTRQAEALATWSYRRLLDNATLRAEFETDVTIAAFWQRPDHERKAIWGAALDLTIIT